MTHFAHLVEIEGGEHCVEDGCADTDVVVGVFLLISSKSDTTSRVKKMLVC